MASVRRVVIGPYAESNSGELAICSVSNGPTNKEIKRFQDFI